MRPAVVEIDLASVTETIELHVLLEERLGFPGYYGRNWDAFWDCVRNDEQSTMPTVLRLRGWAQLRKQMRRDAELLKEILDRMESERPDLHIEWV